ncbi:MAG: hypothetical protein GYA55_12730, partial [SAR324 cluster bacterium]|nr:hypothetical protein [SAR324 cluster bacterium]
EVIMSGSALDLSRVSSLERPEIYYWLSSSAVRPNCSGKLRRLLTIEANVPKIQSDLVGNVHRNQDEKTNVQDSKDEIGLSPEQEEFKYQVERALALVKIEREQLFRFVETSCQVIKAESENTGNLQRDRVVITIKPKGSNPQVNEEIRRKFFGEDMTGAKLNGVASAVLRKLESVYGDSLPFFVDTEFEDFRKQRLILLTNEIQKITDQIKRRGGNGRVKLACARERVELYPFLKELNANGISYSVSGMEIIFYQTHSG